MKDASDFSKQSTAPVATAAAAKLALDAIEPKVKPPEDAGTLLGKVVEFGWNTVAGEGKTEAERASRAQKSDQYAEIAADTLASIPKFGRVIGGLSRGTLLADVSGQHSWLEVGGKFLSDSAQGAALNQVGKFGFNRFTANPAGLTLRSELSTHFLTGAGFGAVKTAFNPNSYKDVNGNFSALATTQNFATGIGVGGALSVPAGFAGMRVSRASSLWLGGGEQTAARLLVRDGVANTTGGFTGGAIFGGVEAARESLDPAKILAGAWEGGIIGGLTGGASGLADRRVHTVDGKTRTVVDTPESTVKSETALPRVELSETSAVPKVTGDNPDGKTATPRVDGADGPLTSASADAPLGIASSDVPGNILMSRLGKSLLDTTVHLDGSPQFEIPNFRTRYEIKHGKQEREALDLAALAASSKKGDAGKRIEDMLLDRDAYDALKRFNFKPFEGARVGQIESRMSVPQTVTRVRHELPPGFSTKHEDIVALLDAKGKGGRADMNEWFAELNVKNENFRVYDVQGLKTRISISEDYATQLEPVRDLRKAVENAATESDRAAAQKALDAHPLGKRALPEDVIAMLDGMPESGLYRDIELSGTPNIHDYYRRYQYDSPDFRAEALVHPDGDMTLIRPVLGHDLTLYMSHELAHLTRWRDPKTAADFDKAQSLDLLEMNINRKASRQAREADPKAPDVEEKGIYQPSEHASRNNDEGWAVAVGEELLNPDSNSAAYYASKAPVRTMVLAPDIIDGIKREGNLNNPEHQKLIERMQYLEDAVKPMAYSILQERAQWATQQQRADAAVLLGKYGDKAEHTDFLRKMALDPKNEAVPKVNGVITPGAISPKQAAFEGMVRLQSRNVAQQIDFAVREGLANPALREVAAKFVGSQNESRAPFYRRLLEFDGSMAAAPDLFNLLRSNQHADLAGRQFAYDAMTQALSANKSRQIEYDAKLFEARPELRERIFNHMEGMVRAGLNPTEQSLMRRAIENLPPLSGNDLYRSQEILLGIDLHNRVVSARATATDRRASQAEQLIAVRALSREGGNEAVTPLLHLAVSGRTAVESAAITALNAYSPTLVKFYAREVKTALGNNPEAQARLQALLNGNRLVRR